MMRAEHEIANFNLQISSKLDRKAYLDRTGSFFSNLTKSVHGSIYKIS